MNSIKTNMKFIVSILLLMLIGVSCKSRKHEKKTVQTQAVDTLQAKCKLPFKSARTLSKHIKESELNYNWIVAKADVDVNIDGEDHKFDVKIKSKKDSAIWISIQAVGGLIDIAKLNITKDSVKMVIYIKRQYFKGDFNYINDILNADLDYDMLQAALFGNSASFYDEDEKLNSIIDRVNCHYMLSTERKRKLKRIMSGQDSLKHSLQTMTLMNDSYKIVNNHFEDVTTNRVFNAQYDNFLAKDSVFAPHDVNIEIKAEKKITLKINYVRIEINVPQKIALTIPKNYDAIPIKKD